MRDLAPSKSAMRGLLLLLCALLAFAATTGVPFNGVVATFSDADPNGTASDYTATIVWGDGHVRPAS